MSSLLRADNASASKIELSNELNGYENKLLQDLKSSPKDPLVLGAIADFLSNFPDRTDEAASYFDRALRAFPSPLPDHFKTAYSVFSCQYASVVSQSGDVSKASALYQQSLSLDPASPLALGDYAVFLHRVTKDYALAKKAYEAALDRHPSHSSIWSKYASFLKVVSRDVPAAMKAHQNAVRYGPSNADSLSSYAVFLHGLGGRGGGQQPSSSSSGKSVVDSPAVFYERALQADPLHVNNLSNYGLYLAEVLGDGNRAAELYKRAIELDPTHANSFYNYAVLCDNHNGDNHNNNNNGAPPRDVKRAEELYRSCLSVCPSHAFACYNLAVLVEEVRGSLSPLGQSEADDLFRRAVSANESDAQTVADYGRFKLVTCKDPVSAEALLRRAISIDGECVVANYNLGMLLATSQGSQPSTDAGRHFGKVLAVDPNHAEANLFAARIAADKGDKVLADKHYRAAGANAKGGARQAVETEYSAFKAKAAGAKK